MKNLVKDASMGPLREALRQGIEITKLKKEDIRPVNLQVHRMQCDEPKIFKNIFSLINFKMVYSLCRTLKIPSTR